MEHIDKMTMNDIMQFLHTTYTIVLPIFMAYVIDMCRRHNRKKDISEEAIKLILRIFLMNIHDRCCEKGYATNEEYQTYVEIWDLYHDGYKGNLLSERHKQDMDDIEIRPD